MEYGQSKSLYALRRQACCHGKEVNAISGGVAQLGEHLPCKQGVRSSILLISTRFSFMAYLDNCIENEEIPLF